MNPFRAGQPVSARILNAMKASADVIRRLRPGRFMSIRQAGDGAIFECTLPFLPRILARVTRVLPGSGSDSSGSELGGSGCSGSGGDAGCPGGAKPVYAFHEVESTCGGQWQAKSYGTTGDGDVNPAYTINDASVADGAVCELIPGKAWWDGCTLVTEWVILSTLGSTAEEGGSGADAGSGAAGGSGDDCSGTGGLSPGDLLGCDSSGSARVAQGCIRVTDADGNVVEGLGLGLFDATTGERIAGGA